MKNISNIVFLTTSLLIFSNSFSQQTIQNYPKNWNPSDKTSALEQLNSTLKNNLKNFTSTYYSIKSADNVPTQLRCMSDNGVEILKNRYGVKLITEYANTRDLYKSDTQDLAFPRTTGSHVVGYQCFARQEGPDGWHACIGLGNCNTAGYIFLNQNGESDAPVVHVYNEGDQGKYVLILWFSVIGEY